VPVEISIIVPVHNEEANILPLACEVAQAFESTDHDYYELVFVDDASIDATWARIREAAQKDPRVRGLRHLRNSGQSAAIWTGIQNSSGPIIATLDGDLQNDPADLPEMLRGLADADFVCGVRHLRQDSPIRRLSSNVARQARKLILGVDFRDIGCALRVFKRSALEGIFPFNGLHRFLPVLVQASGAKTKEVAVNHRPRVTGVSKYGIWNRLGRGVVDLLAIAWYQRRRYRPVSFERCETERMESSRLIQR
jgi:dolichol-phosphate mannosyltransferase